MSPSDIFGTFMRFRVLSAVIVDIMVFCDVMSNRLVGKYRHFGGTFCLHLGERSWIFLYLGAKLLGAALQDIVISVFSVCLKEGFSTSP
jgi:hypothetical protein